MEHMNEITFLKLENLFLALSDKTRLRLLALMAGGEVPVGFLADQLGESQPKISRHLAYLRSAGLVSTRRDGKRIYYGIDKQEDRSVARVLHATLSSIAARDVDEPGVDTGSDAANYTKTNYIGSDTSAETNMTDCTPNEIEIFLL